MISLLYQAAHNLPAMLDNRTGIATFFVNSQHSSSSNSHSRFNSAHLNKLKRRSHLSNNLTSSSSNSHSNNNKEFHQLRFPSSRWTNKRISEHSRLHQTNRMVVATSSRLLACGLMVKRSNRLTVWAALHSALPKIRKRKVAASRRNCLSERPAMRQHKHSKPL